MNSLCGRKLIARFWYYDFTGPKTGLPALGMKKVSACGPGMIPGGESVNIFF